MLNLFGNFLSTFCNVLEMGIFFDFTFILIQILLHQLWFYPHHACGGYL